METLSREAVAEAILAIEDPEEQAEAAALALEIYGEAPQVERFSPFRFRPHDYITHFLGWQPWAGENEELPGQTEIIDAYQLALQQQFEKRDYEAGRLKKKDLKYWKPDQVIQFFIRMEAGHTVGKCVIIGDMITLADGERVTAKDLIGRSFELLTLNPDGTPVAVPAIAGENGIKPVFELTTETGRNIRRTGNHPLWATRANFKPGYRPQISEGAWTPLCDLLVGDLVAVPEILPAFGLQELPEHEIKLLAYLIGDGGTSQNTVRFSQKESPQLDEYKECADQIGCRLVKLNKYDYIAYAKGPRTGKPNSNPLLNLVRRYGLNGKTAGQKRIPAEIFKLPKDQLRMFLSRLYSTDGWACVDKRNHREIGYCSKSREMLEEIQHLLLRFGVHGRITEKRKVAAWVLTVNNAIDIDVFCREIGIYGKEPAVEALMQHIAPTVETKERNISDRPDRPRWIHKNALPGTRWEKVVGVRYIGDEPTVGIEVPEFDTYLSDFYEHNTKLATGIISHFFDCFAPSVVTMYAPTHPTLRDNLWEELRTDRIRTSLPGRILESIEIRFGPNHYIKGRAIPNSTAKGTETIQGKHGELLMFILDEAEGIPDFVFSAIDSMTSGGICIVLMMANPKTRTSKFHRIKDRANVKSFRISCLNHPNVVAGREIVPNAVQREYVRSMIEQHCEAVLEHNPDDETFELHWEVVTRDRVYPPGTIFKPNHEFCWRVLGVAPGDISDKTVIPAGRYNAARLRKEVMVFPEDEDRATMGIDVARFGTDYGTLYVRWKNEVWRAKQFYQQDSKEYFHAVRDIALELNQKGVQLLHIRIDAGGDSSGLIDTLKDCQELREAFVQFQVVPVQFGASAEKNEVYDNLVTQLYFEARETLNGIRLINPPEALESDLTLREWEPVNRSGRELKKLQDKKAFRKEIKRSPDDGDGFVLCIAPDHVVGSGELVPPITMPKRSVWG